METKQNQTVDVASVNYDEPPIAEAELSGFAYRLDADRGSSVAISRRVAGTWTWTPIAEGRWDGSRLRAKGLEAEVVNALACALGAAMRERAEGSF